MKRLFCLMFLIAFLCGCAAKYEAEFFYPRTQIQYHKEDGVIASESRDITGHGEDLHFLLSLYLMGPLNEDFSAPFPVPVKLVSVRKEAGILTIQLSEMPAPIADTEFTLGCACLTMTGLELTDAHTVTILCGDRTVTLTRDSLTLFDSNSPTETTNGGNE